MSMQLEEWYQLHHSDNDCIKLFGIMDLTMKSLHQQEYYITNFNLKNIIVNDKNGLVVLFKYVDKFSDNVQQKINENIYNAACLHLALYMGIEPQNLNIEYLKRNFQEFKIFIPKEVLGYYERVLSGRGNFYLTDYMQTKNEQELKKYMNSTSSDGGRSLVKRTGHYANEELETPKKSENDIAAFVTTYALSFFIIAASVLIPIICFLLGARK